MKCVILAGGQGTRMREETEIRPKPMISIGTHPILWHIMKNFSHFGVKEFIVCAGYKGEMIKDYFRNFLSYNSDFTITIEEEPKIQYHERLEEFGWRVTVSDTGQLTPTGGRLFRIRDFLAGETDFICTYGDGLANVDVSQLIRFHRSHGKIATVTAVRPISRFGVMDVQPSGVVQSFREKPQADGWINVGFFVFNTKVFEYLHDDTTLETEPLATLAGAGELMAFKHEGFWQPMDTYREFRLFNDLWDKGDAPWKVW